jgi:N-acyl-D-aspartate/D-glutamate deacylase
MPADLVIRGARIIDGTGRDGYTADVEVRDGRITSIGRSTDAALQEIDAHGLVLAPDDIQYICVASMLDSEQKQTRMCVQIILHKIVNKMTPFLEIITGKCF